MKARDYTPGFVAQSPDPATCCQIEASESGRRDSNPRPPEPHSPHHGNHNPVSFGASHCQLHGLLLVRSRDRQE